MFKKNAKTFFSAAILVLTVALAGVVVYAYDLGDLGAHGIYAPLKVEKVWNDKGYEKERPDSITFNVAVESGGGSYGTTYSIGEKDGWRWSTSGNLLGNPCRVSEIPMVGYRTGYEISPDDNGYKVTITNTYDPTKYTVTYHDLLKKEQLVEGEEPFADEAHKDLRYNSKTPDYNDGNAPQHTGYNFQGWSKYKDYAWPYMDSIVQNDQDYWAIWTKTYTITYVDGVEDEEVFADQKHPVEVKVTPTLDRYVYTPRFEGANGSREPAREGYEFTGWTPKVDTFVTGDKTYTATWKKTDKKYTVTYKDSLTADELKEGEEPFETEVHKDILHNARTPEYNNGIEPKHEGYKFAGWYPTVYDYVTKDMTYEARWVEAYTVTYTDGVEDEEVFEDQVYPNCGYGDETPAFHWNPVTRMFTAASGETADIPVREGYKFTGWTPEVDPYVYGNAVYTATWEKDKDPEPTTPTTPVTPIYYTVTYTDGVEGEEVFADQVTDKLVYGTKTPEFAGEPLRDGYTFEGWTPVVADLVTGNAIYTATWKPVENLDEPDVPLSPGITLPPDEFLDDPETPLGPAPKLTDDVDDPDQPKTGDEMPLMDLAGIMIIAIGALGAVCLTRRKHS
ncbi:InlB B-repeat-containing protein [Ihubacter sp. mB4P-1]|uniref:InlB B-repeat-containing protein n=1 Tax=Ihubacter sp. mB4P-1 TaxID=3242370 RepID=UPI003C7E2F65